MELIEICCSVLGVTSILVLYCVLNWLWFEPKKAEKFLREQGLNGSSYRFMFGDWKEMAQMSIEANSKPMSLSHDIAPRVFPFLHKSANTHGKNYFTWAGPKPIINISEPTMIRDIFANYRQFRKETGGNSLFKLLASGLASTEADQWVKHRKIINPAFHVEKLKHMVPAFYVSCNEMIHKWEEMLSENNLSEVDVWPHLERFSCDVISRTAFGSSFEEGRKIFELQKERTKLVLKAAQSFYIPGLRFLPTKSKKRIKETDVGVKTLIRKIIDQRVVAMKAGKTSNDDLLGILLNSNYEEIKQHENNNAGLSIEEIIEECNLFYFAGQETTANTIVWTMILLGLHMDWQTRAKEEVLRVFGDKTPYIDGLNRLKIINMIFNEVLRLYPSATALIRMTHKDTTLGNLRLRAQTMIQLNLLFLHHDHEIWGDNANMFNPERFSEGVSKATKGQTTFFPFGAGPRICIGQNFAMLEAKMALVMILQRFSFKLSPSYSHAPCMVTSLQPQFGAHLILHKL